MEENVVNQNKQSATLNPYASNMNYTTGYKNVDNLTNQSNQLLNNSLNSQVQAIDYGTQNNINELNRQKEKATSKTDKENKAFYQQYQKAVNPYGVNAESLAAQGLKGAGIAETTKTNIYNQYQKNISDSLNNLKQISADYDAKMSEVRANGDIAKAQELSNMYLQQLESIKYAYSLAEAQKEFEYNKSVNDRNYNYQISRDKIEDQRYNDELAYKKERDKVSDDQWRQQYELSKKNSNSTSASKSTKTGISKAKNIVSNSLDIEDTNTSDVDTSKLQDFIKKVAVGGYLGLNMFQSGINAISKRK